MFDDFCVRPAAKHTRRIARVASGETRSIRRHGERDKRFSSWRLGTFFRDDG